MEEVKNSRKIIELFKKLGNEWRYRTLSNLLNDEVIDIAPAMTVYAQHLATYKQNAQIDIQTLSRAGLDLAEKEIKKISGTKSRSLKELKTAQAQTLISGGGYVGTKFGDKLEKCVDMKIVDGGWYESCWALKTVKTSYENPELLK